MPNYCDAKIIVTGNARCVDEFTKIIQADYSYTEMRFTHTPHFFRVFEAGIIDEKINGLMKQTTYDITCAWSVYCCMMNGPLSYYDENKSFADEYGVFYGTYLNECAKRLGLFIEVFSVEPGVGFNEYYLIDNHGYTAIDQTYEMRNYDLNDYKSRDDFIKQTGDYISEEDYKWSMDEYEGWYATNGYDPDETGYISEKLCNPIKLVAAKVVNK